VLQMLQCGLFDIVLGDAVGHDLGLYP
jgi:hypothetical protein